jgi:ATP-dependent Zn protease
MRRICAILVLLCLLAPAPLSLAATPAITESYAALVHQIDNGQVVEAHVNETDHHISVILKNGSKEFVSFPAAQHKKLVDSLLHHGVTPIFTTPKKAPKPVHHVLRYVAAGVVVVLLLIGGGVWVYTRGQRQPPEGESGDGRRPDATDPPDTPAESM